MEKLQVLKEGLLRKKQISKVSIKLASPDTILQWSRGEVTKPETINYRTYKPERDGLFCEKIFGPVKDWECHCGKYKRIRYRGVVCDRCGVEVTQRSVRRERMGHIELAVPVVHIWYLRSVPSKIGSLLGMSTKDLEKIVYYESYVVIKPGKTGLKEKDLITEEQYQEILEKFPDNDKLPDDHPDKFIAKMGGEAIRDLLRNIDIEELSNELKAQLAQETSEQKKYEILKRLKVVEAFNQKVVVKGKEEFINKPEWMVLTIIPVIPPELRPLVPLEGGRFATSDLNDLYRRVIIRNNRLKRLKEIKAPEIILRNEKRMLQEAVDALLDNSRRVNAVKADTNRPLKSLSDILKGKQGRFRQNLLGKRVDYSGRSVIVVGPELKLHQCGLPKDMAVELFKPFLIRKLMERGYAKAARTAKKIIERKDPIIWEILEKVVEGHPVLLNRAPTLHRLGIQAFQPVLTDAKAIQLHPLVCVAFNADFDGDQMAVHVPLSYEAQLEARILMLSSHNLLKPADGKPITIATQDIVLGLYYLTKERAGEPGEGKTFSSPEEVIIAHNSGKLGLHAKIKVRILNQETGKYELVETTTGRVIFNQIVPKGIGFINEVLTKKKLTNLIAKIYNKFGNVITAEFLDEMKDMGFYYATKSGISIGIPDVIVPEEKEQIIAEYQRRVDIHHRDHLAGEITDTERYNKVIDEWSAATEKVAKVLFEKLSKINQGFNPLFVMLDSGARGSKDQIRQLGGMRGLMQKPQKGMTGQPYEMIEHPILSNFREGLSIWEYFLSTHGARKGLADTALKTSDAGYLTRRLVDVAQDVVVTEEDCGTVRGITMTALKEEGGEEVMVSLADRIVGRVALHDIYHPITGEIIVESGHEITEELAQKIEEAGIDEVEVRSVLTCESKYGVCVKCYGRNLATGRMVEVGEAVGIIAAQSIGEPGTQLTLRTFHTGGSVAGAGYRSSKILAKNSGKVRFVNIKYIEYEKMDEYEHETVLRVISRHGYLLIEDEKSGIARKYAVPYASDLKVRDGQFVEKGAELYETDPYNSLILAEKSGRVELIDFIPDVTYREEADETTGHMQRVIIEAKDKTKVPKIKITTPEGEEYYQPIPVRALVDENLNDGVNIKAGDIIAKIPREQAKIRDITGGLPKVVNLFEARTPNNPAELAEIDGVVSVRAEKNYYIVRITSDDGQFKKEYQIPQTKHLLVEDGDRVYAGDRLTDGPIDPHKILSIKGLNAVQQYLVNEIQDVYRNEGVEINDKHIEVIVRQMMRKVKITNPGDTKFLERDIVDKDVVDEENDRIRGMVVITSKGDSKFKVGQLKSRNEVERENENLKRKKKKPAEYRPAKGAEFEPILLGITSAALTSESWISAASFQETTRVLTDAAIEAKVDYLRGLKENVVVGQLIPAGTGFRNDKKDYRDVRVMPKEGVKEFEKVEEEKEKAQILEKKAESL
ncbi:DNA-directed RNA polymerase subunit beta' [Candidatus Kryptonium thompsonii]|jgi:DNA-directed RNA polymerase subunit beta'|uniref:DNA-directed RNA polymerase subunit beta' n=1 Tax=Candidatus Kryptonium thompsonii TaxID=1633631 RepID=A0A0P1LMC0_9BACT|nr:DNA-directed RNA polymerase subunit beta' [Candidatus Kryptonium thompsoni]CUS78693.1 DNA-directed RNA polymerase subunit beta' [Candidatus Kryptonium thompsoni]CUS81144.1 DNA-directed RNA polymerase subunit beta' [Candidatus Kryptonium thompsoni]CUS82002.1 DNA-directed RNA polymerase subunit beta' [Candidatus Kryptonium thompsoni]CUS89041.1 DNA-directed RNA polymerase subunit beta' [Candidatus Kryptonium thompsoni]CUT01737.1 DNA-directed RNA polymerase subunit beta' [Candidatus Kryptonium 